MTIRDFDPKSPHPLTTVLKRLPNSLEAVRKGGAAVARQVKETQSRTRTSDPRIEGK